MAKRFLSRELIVSVAFQMIDEKGMENFSVRQLAAKLGVQVSSLYNHIKNEDDLLLEVVKRTSSMYTDNVIKSVDGLSLDDATHRAGDVFRAFLKEHHSLYELLIDKRWKGNPEYEKAVEYFTLPIYSILQQYGVTEQKSAENLLVAIKVITHGFSTLELLGAFDNLSVDITETYHIIIQSVIDAMKNIQKKQII